MKTTFEYRTLLVSNFECISPTKFNELGRDGWEAVGILRAVSYDTKAIILFKRMSWSPE